MQMNAYALAFEQARNDLSWIDRELERLHNQQKVLAELVNCLKHFVPDGHAATQEHGAESDGAEHHEDSPVLQAMEHEGANHEAGEPVVEHAMQ